MLIKQEKGLTGIDITISIIIITIFIALIANLITNINLSSKDIEKKTQATSYAVDEIEKISEAGINTITLGKRILRTETAGEAVLSMIMYEIGDINK